MKPTGFKITKLRIKMINTFKVPLGRGVFFAFLCLESAKMQNTRCRCPVAHVHLGTVT